MVLRCCSEVDVDVQDCDGQTPLHLAAIHHNLNATTLLLRHHADVTLTDFLGLTAETRARLRGHDIIAEMISETVNGTCAL